MTVATADAAVRGAAAPAHHSLDLRGLSAPEPMIRALEAADALAPGATLEVFTPMLPLPLLEALAERGLRVRAERLHDGSARVIVQCGAMPAGADDEAPH